MSGRKPTAAVKVTLTRKRAEALHWFLRHIAFSDALESTPPHLGRDHRSEKAYGIVHAAAHFQDSLERAGVHGDSWMYCEPAAAPAPRAPSISGEVLK